MRIGPTTSTFVLSLVLCGLSSAKADLVNFVADINGTCTETGSTATGSGVFTLNTQSGVFTWNITHDLKAATFAHIHGPIAQACGSQGGGLIVKDVGPVSPMTGSMVFTATQQQHVLDGLYYVNIHTDKFSTGEIAGVIVRAPEIDKCRHISLIPGHPGVSTAIRVHLTSLHHVSPPYSGGPSIPFTTFEGQDRWAGPTVQYIESNSSGITFHASKLQCMPHYQDWGSILMLHINGSAIVPSSIYDVDILDSSCMGNETGCAAILDSYTIGTSRWADLELPYNPPSTSAQPDFADVSALVNKFKSLPGAAAKARALLAGDDAFGSFSVNTMGQDLSFTHIAACVDAFRGKSYPYVIESCP